MGGGVLPVMINEVSFVFFYALHGAVLKYVGSKFIILVSQNAAVASRQDDGSKSHVVGHLKRQAPGVADHKQAVLVAFIFEVILPEPVKPSGVEVHFFCSIAFSNGHQLRPSESTANLRYPTVLPYQIVDRISCKRTIAPENSTMRLNLLRVPKGHGPTVSEYESCFADMFIFKLRNPLDLV